MRLCADVLADDYRLEHEVKRCRRDGQLSRRGDGLNGIWHVLFGGANNDYDGLIGYAAYKPRRVSADTVTCP